MRNGKAPLVLVALLGLGGGLAQDTTNVSVTLAPNGAEDAGCLLGKASFPVGDFGPIIPDGDTWRGSNEVVLSIPLSQNVVPQAIDCRIEIVASDLAIAGTSASIPASHLAIAGCDLLTPVSLAVPRGISCNIDTHTTYVKVTVSLLGLDHPPTATLRGTIVLSIINGT
jgi:hypothetical protein